MPAKKTPAKKPSSSLAPKIRINKLTIAIFGAVVATIGIFAVYKTFASSQWLNNPWRMMGTNVCWDVPAGNYYAGAKLQLWDCNGLTPQKWIRPTDGTLRPAGNSGLCIDIPNYNTTPGTQLILWPCTGGRNQKWYWDYSTWTNSPNRYHTFKSELNPNLCIDDGGGRGLRSDRLIIWNCTGGNPQRWTF